MLIKVMSDEIRGRKRKGSLGLGVGGPRDKPNHPSGGYKYYT